VAGEKATKCLYMLVYMLILHLARIIDLIWFNLLTLACVFVNSFWWIAHYFCFIFVYCLYIQLCILFTLYANWYLC